MKITLSLKAFLVGSINPQLAKIITKLPLKRLALSTIICQIFFFFNNEQCLNSLFIQELDLHSSILEGDFETSINAIWSKNLLQSSFGHIVKDIVSSANSLQNFSFSHIIRQDNTLAHALAKREALSFPILLWIRSVSSDIHKTFLTNFLAIQ